MVRVDPEARALDLGESRRASRTCDGSRSVSIAFCATGIFRADDVGDDERAVGPKHAKHLVEDPPGLLEMMNCKPGDHRIEGAFGERELGCAAFSEGHVLATGFRASLPGLAQHFRCEVEGDDLARLRGQRRSYDSGTAGNVEDDSRCIGADGFAEAPGQLVIGNRCRSREGPGLTGEFLLHALKVVQWCSPLRLAFADRNSKKAALRASTAVSIPQN